MDQWSKTQLAEDKQGGSVHSGLDLEVLGPASPLFKKRRHFGYSEPVPRRAGKPFSTWLGTYAEGDGRTVCGSGRG
eukprot:3892113-Amphidinium_carterae.1